MTTEITITVGTPEFTALHQRIVHGITASEALSLLRFDDGDAIRAAWTHLTGHPVDPSFALIPPVFSDHGTNIRVGRNVFINRGCTLMDIGGIDIADDVMIGPNVSLISSGHPLDPQRRRTQVTAAPIRIERNVWLGAGATVLQGVTVGEDSVVAAGAVVTRDVPAGTVVGGIPATVLKHLPEPTQ